MEAVYSTKMLVLLTTSHSITTQKTDIDLVTEVYRGFYQSLYGNDWTVP
jgi:hypothetical protein